MWEIFKALSIGSKFAIIGSIVAVLLAIAGSSYYIGYDKGNTKSQLAVTQYEKKISDLNTQLSKAQGQVTTDVVTKYQDRIKYVDRVSYKTKDVIRYKVPEQFMLSKGWVYTYNQSVLGLDVDPSLATNKVSSGVSDKEALGIINDNNGVCLANKEQVLGLQDWIKGQEKASEKVSSNSGSRSK